jgi:hypothetical protein
MTLKRTLSCLLLMLFMATSLNAQPSPEAQIPELARELNVWRLSLGLGPLVYNPTLERMAAVQADFLLSLPGIPNDIHAGARGENPRQRSQFEEFAWPTYGHPEIISVTEIAAIGSISSAINFWMNSDIHNRSVTNPNFREVGIAARQYGSDIMFIVVLGSRPDVLPALLDRGEVNELLLTNERAEWTGDWIGVATEYRFLDAEQQPLIDWTPWDDKIELADELLEEDTLFIEYRDAADHRTQYEIAYNPSWTSLPIPETIARPSATPTAAAVVAEPTADDEDSEEGNSGIFTENTAVPTATITPSPMPTRTPFPTFTPTVTPIPGLVIFFYNDNVFTLYNAGGGFLDVSGISFRRDDIGFDASFWEEVSPGLNLSALPASQCLVVEPEDGNEYIADRSCTEVRSLVQEPDPRYFWLGDFEVIRDGEVIATCDGDADRCELTLN